MANINQSDLAAYFQSRYPHLSLGEVEEICTILHLMAEGSIDDALESNDAHNEQL